MIQVYSIGRLSVEWLNVPQDIIKSFLQKGEMGHFWYLGALIIVYVLLPWMSSKSSKSQKNLLFLIGTVCFIIQTISFFIAYPFIVARIMKVNSLTEAVCFWLIVLIISAGITWIIGRIKIGRYLTKI